MVTSNGSNSNIDYMDDLDGDGLVNVDFECDHTLSTELIVSEITAFCIDSYEKASFVDFSCSEKLEKITTDPFTSLSYVIGEAVETTTLSNYELGCGSDATDLTLSFQDGSLNDMVATYSWFSTSDNEFTVDPTDGTIGPGTWTVTVTASYFSSHNSVTLTESTFVFDLEVLGSGNSAPILTTHNCNAASVTVDSSITCTFSVYSDPDAGDALTLSIESG